MSTDDELRQILEKVCAYHGFTNPHKKAGAIYWMNETIKALYANGFIKLDELWIEGKFDEKD